MVSSISVTLIVIILYGGRTATTAFSPQYRHSSYQHQSSKKFQTSTTSLCMISDREAPDEEGADLASQFFKAVSERDISFEGGKYWELFFVVSSPCTMHNNLHYHS